jgi:hypothetical protein
MDIVAKIGTSSLTDDRGEIRHEAIAKLCGEVAALRHAGHRVVVVTSGAIAAGLPALGLSAATRPRDASPGASCFPGVCFWQQTDPGRPGSVRGCWYPLQTATVERPLQRKFPVDLLQQRLPTQLPKGVGSGPLVTGTQRLRRITGVSREPQDLRRGGLGFHRNRS